jgi:hypothetical protein
MAAASRGTAKKAGKKKNTSGVIDVDLNNVEVREAYDGDDPRPGFYSFTLVNVRAHTSQAGNEGIAWLFTLADDPLYEGWTRTVHSNTLADKVEGSTLWKTHELMLALAGGNAVKGTKQAKVHLDVTDQESVDRYLKKAKKVRGRVQRRRDSDDDDPQYEIGKIIALDEAKLAARAAALGLTEDDEDEDEDGFEDADEFEEDDEEDDESEDEDDEDSDEDEDEDEEEDDEDEEDEEDEDEEETPEPPKKAKKAAAAKPAAKKVAAKVTKPAEKKKKAKK